MDMNMLMHLMQMLGQQGGQQRRPGPQQPSMMGGMMSGSAQGRPMPQGGQMQPGYMGGGDQLGAASGALQSMLGGMGGRPQMPQMPALDRPETGGWGNDSGDFNFAQPSPGADFNGNAAPQMRPRGPQSLAALGTPRRGF